MPVFGSRSLANLATLHPDLQRVMRRAILTYDFTVVEGARGREAQEKAYKAGHSKAKFGQSPHNYKPSLAVDCIPYPTGYDAPTAEFGVMAGHIMAAAHYEGVKLDWGGRWRSLKDYPHFELTSWRSHLSGTQLAE